MLISCPACPKMYRVPASAIPPEGREVSCSACSTVWYERGIEAEVVNVGAGAFATSSATVAYAACKTSHARPEAARAAKANVEPQVTSRDSNVIALWEGDRAKSDFDEVPTPEFMDTDPTEGPGVTAPDETNQAPEVSSEETAQAAAEVASFFTSEKWDARWPTFGSLKSRVDSWRKSRPVKPITEGTSAALKFRDRIRTRERNRLTPMRRVGWTAFIATISVISVVIADRELMEDVWPGSAKSYAALFGAREVTRPLDLMDVTTRYAQSIEGPVLEIRGTVINNGTAPVVPLLELSVDDEVLADYESVPLSKVTVPVRGERPFVVRAMVPEGTLQAEIRLLADVQVSPGGMEGFILQQTGSGWGRAMLPPLPREAVQNAR